MERVHPDWLSPADYLQTVQGTFTALLAGPQAAAYLKPGIDGSVRFMASEALEDALGIADAMIRRTIQVGAK